MNMQSSSMVVTDTPFNSPNLSITSSSSQPYTILRIKRKRNEEPLDALVVESVKRKKTRGLGVFQYAETVEADAWDDAARQRDIQERITMLSQHPSTQAQVRKDSPPSPTVPRTKKEELSRRYTIIDNDDPEIPNKRYPTAPPKVLSSKDLEAQQSAKTSKPSLPKDFKMYDAIPAGQPPAVQDHALEMDKFLPLLNDYLKIHDINPAMEVSPEFSKDLSPVGPGSGEDYVWDVFYHRPVTLSEWNAAAANVGTLTGLPSSLEGYDSLSDSDDEYLDEADEDSNAEEYYKNDYPDEENSDEFHEDSEFEDMLAQDDDHSE